MDKDYLVADVHTAPPDDRDRGGVLHQAVGKIDLMVISVKSGNDITAYIGPVYSYFEFSTDGVKRIADSEWTKMVEGTQVVLRPTWTAEYLK